MMRTRTRTGSLLGCAGAVLAFGASPAAAITDNQPEPRVIGDVAADERSCAAQDEHFQDARGTHYSPSCARNLSHGIVSNHNETLLAD